MKVYPCSRCDLTFEDADERNRHSELDHRYRHSSETVVVNIYRDGVNGYEVDVEGGSDLHIVVMLHHPEDESDKLYERDADSYRDANEGGQA